MGWFRPVHCKSVSAQEVRALLAARKTIQQGMIALELSLRRLRRNFGLKVGAISRGQFDARIRELVDGNAMLQAAAGPMLRARASLRHELAGLERQVRLLAKDDAVCRLLMTMPGIGAVVALTFRSAVDDPARFSSSKKVGPWVGLTPSSNQSGERDVIGGITRAGGRQSTKSLVPSGYRHDPSGSLDMAAELGCTSCQTPRCKACDGGFGKAHRHNPAPDVDGGYGILHSPVDRQVGLSVHSRTISLTSV